MYLTMLLCTTERPTAMTANYGFNFNRREVVVDYKSVVFTKVMSGGIALQLFLRSLEGFMLFRSWWGGGVMGLEGGCLGCVRFGIEERI